MSAESSLANVRRRLKGCIESQEKRLLESGRLQEPEEKDKWYDSDDKFVNDTRDGENLLPGQLVAIVRKEMQAVLVGPVQGAEQVYTVRDIETLAQHDLQRDMFMIVPTRPAEIGERAVVFGLKDDKAKLNGQRCVVRRSVVQHWVVFEQEGATDKEKPRMELLSRQHLAALTDAPAEPSVAPRGAQVAPDANALLRPKTRKRIVPQRLPAGSICSHGSAFNPEPPSKKNQVSTVGPAEGNALPIRPSQAYVTRKRTVPLSMELVAQLAHVMASMTHDERMNAMQRIRHAKGQKASRRYRCCKSRRLRVFRRWRLVRKSASSAPRAESTCTSEALSIPSSAAAMGDAASSLAPALPILDVLRQSQSPAGIKTSSFKSQSEEQVEGIVSEVGIQTGAETADPQQSQDVAASFFHLQPSRETQAEAQNSRRAHVAHENSYAASADKSNSQTVSSSRRIARQKAEIKDTAMQSLEFCMEEVQPKKKFKEQIRIGKEHIITFKNESHILVD